METEPGACTFRRMAAIHSRIAPGLNLKQRLVRVPCEHAFLMWKRNMDKRFEGVEDCCICYSCIHGANFSLPDKRCKTCKNAFHSACLYKWFNSSQQASCPMCRNIWM